MGADDRSRSPAIATSAFGEEDIVLLAAQPVQRAFRIEGDGVAGDDSPAATGARRAVSYTHLTLPTIYSV